MPLRLVLLAMIVLSACSDRVPEECSRATACSSCLAGQPEGTLCFTRWEECAANAPCTAALPTLSECLCAATTRGERVTCAGQFGSVSDKAFNLAYCVNVDACHEQCLE